MHLSRHLKQEIFGVLIKDGKPFNGLRPSSMSGTEEEIFNKNMETVVKAILGYCRFSRDVVPIRGVGIGTSPNLAPVSPDKC